MEGSLGLGGVNLEEKRFSKEKPSVVWSLRPAEEQASTEGTVDVQGWALCLCSQTSGKNQTAGIRKLPLPPPSTTLHGRGHAGLETETVAWFCVHQPLRAFAKCSSKCESPENSSWSVARRRIPLK